MHYLALRQHDLRDLQHELTALGLSSLGRAEPYVLATLEAVQAHQEKKRSMLRKLGISRFD